MSRLIALEPPYEPEVAELLAAMMPPGAPPIALFRTMVRNRPMTAAMHGLGRYELGRGLSVSLREREIVILRTCASCEAEYEWGVHAELFARRAELTGRQVAVLTHGTPGEGDWTHRELLLIRLVDSLVATRDLSDELWSDLAGEFSDVQLLDLVVLCGWYQAISQLCRAVQVDLEPTAPRFTDFRQRP
ncbi:MAG: carboxymuconolactone decarboxylase family protein [Acidimicrobiaceae bacterium]|nr:carboxymuconolactone decarboxylase family protein [Acidimicrobiaceae bacterium]